MKYKANQTKSIFRLALTACTALLLAACSMTEQALEAGPESFSPDYIATVTLEPGLSQAALEATYGGQVLLYEADQGFAILGFDQAEAGLSTLSLEPNRDALAVPDLAAQGVRAWAGGVRAWAGGVRAWAGGGEPMWGGGEPMWGGGEPMWGGGGDPMWGGGSDPMWGGGDPMWAGGEPIFNDNIWQQVGLYDAHLDRASNLGKDVVVAVIDTGLDLSHPAFKGRLVPGWDFIGDDAVAQDEGEGYGYGHGTAVAGIVVQLAPFAKIMPLRVLEADGTGDTDDLALALNWAIDNGADVINLSLGSLERIEAVELLLAKAHDHGIPVVAAAGNTGDENVLFPANRSFNDGGFGDGLIGVGSVSVEDVKSAFSTYGQHKVETVAPGEAIFTTYPGAHLTFATGTSFATPMVSGALALALGEDISAERANDLPVRITKHVMKDLYKLEANKAYRNQLGKGRLDLGAFLEHALK